MKSRRTDRSDASSGSSAHSGGGGDTKWNLRRIQTVTRRSRFLDIDIRDRQALEALFRDEKCDPLRGGGMGCVPQWTPRYSLSEITEEIVRNHGG